MIFVCRFQMSEFARIDLSVYRKDIQSGRETNENGIHYKSCAPNSIGRAVQEARKQIYKNLDEKNHQGFWVTGEKSRLPNSRKPLAVECYANTGEDVWKMHKNTKNDDSNSGRYFKRMDTLSESYIKVPESNIFGLDPESKIKLLRENPSIYFESQKYSQQGTLISVPRDANDERESSVIRFMQRVQDRLLKNMDTMPQVVISSLDVYTSKPFLDRVLDAAQAREYFAEETKKSVSTLEDDFVKVFYRVAESIMKKHGDSIRMARILEGMNPEEIEYQIRRRRKMDAKVYVPGIEDISDDQELQEKILSKSFHDLVWNIETRKKLDKIQEYRLKEIVKKPQPESGLQQFQVVRRNEKKKKNFRVMGKKLQEGEDPKTLFGFDPDSLGHPDPRIQIQKQSFNDLLPKRQRDRLYKRLGIQTCDT